ncbi:hypothetical protein K504DRAFT_500705 [Pleomassaria siparia CBS 279.74]|uniref:F-box domain-containing protein n=1 Tax=Pleomassaria siparia CBS 279.74 TaxID=1314801 RepID=A0A6G1KDQ0_9PLEO|nr:hypothetical protein K504DRAFT_500705 [Pleomassaria siparia CBS 279.74]
MQFSPHSPHVHTTHPNRNPSRTSPSSAPPNSPLPKQSTLPMSITKDRRRFETRVREDAQTWRDRLLGRRLVTPDLSVSSYPRWKNDVYIWEPRVYFCAPPSEGLDAKLTYKTQPASPLLRLPAELRLQILECVVPVQMAWTGMNKLYQKDATWMNTSDVMFCCKQLYAETRAMAVRLHTFEFELLPRRTRLCGMSREECIYIYDL